MVTNLITQALRGDPITIYGDGTQTRSFCYVTDLVEALRALPTHDPRRRRPDITLAQQVLHWQPRTPLRAGLRETIDYLAAASRNPEELTA